MQLNFQENAPRGNFTIAAETNTLPLRIDIAVSAERFFMRVYNETLSEALPLVSLIQGDNSFLYSPQQATAYYRSYFLIEIPCREGFRRKLGLVLKKVSLKVNLKLYELFLT